VKEPSTKFEKAEPKKQALKNFSWALASFVVYFCEKQYV